MSGKTNGGIFTPINLSMYIYSANNPINYKDPNGEFFAQLVGAVFGAVVEVGMQLATNGGDFSDIDWVDVGNMPAVGAITGGLGVTLGKGAKEVHRANQNRKKYNNMAKTIDQKKNPNQKQLIKAQRFKKKASEAKDTIKKVATTQALIATGKKAIKDNINDSDFSAENKDVATDQKAEPKVDVTFTFKREQKEER